MEWGGLSRDGRVTGVRGLVYGVKFSMIMIDGRLSNGWDGTIISNSRTSTAKFVIW